MGEERRGSIWRRCRFWRGSRRTARDVRRVGRRGLKVEGNANWCVAPMLRLLHSGVNQFLAVERFPAVEQLGGLSRIRHGCHVPGFHNISILVLHYNLSPVLDSTQ